MRWIPIALAVLSLASCFVGPLADEEAARVSFSVEIPGVPRLAAETVPQYWDAQGRFHLQDFPKFVQVAVDHQDRELASATWPDPQRGIGQGEDQQGRVTLELTVPAGARRSFRAVAFFVDLEQVLVFEQERSEPVELSAGQAARVPLTMTRVPSGTIDATVRCELGNQGPSRPVRIALVDVGAQLIFPAQDLVLNDVYALKATLRSIPVGRPLLARVELQNLTTGSSAFLELRRTFVAEVPNETRPVLLTVPCTF